MSSSDQDPHSDFRPPRQPLGVRLLDSAERRFGKWAIPGIIRYIAIFQALTFVLSVVFPDYYSKLWFSKELILQGEIWRVISYLFLPPGGLVAMGPAGFVIMFFVIMFMFMINDGLEEAWGSFRLNVYLFSTMLLMTVAAFVTNSAVNPSMIVLASLLMAFACYYPNHQILLMLFIPLKIKYLALLTAGLLIYTSIMLISAGAWLDFLVLLVGMLPFFRVFAPAFVEGRRMAAKNAVRRARFESGLPDPDEAFHRCATCDATEQTEPDREFRIAADGEEYCDQHLPSASASRKS